MRKFLDVLKTRSTVNKAASPAHGGLYVAYLNKPLIALAAMTDDYNTAYNSNPGYKASIYAQAFTEERIPVILSAEDEEMLCQEEYY